MHARYAHIEKARTVQLIKKREKIGWKESWE